MPMSLYGDLQLRGVTAFQRFGGHRGKLAAYSFYAQTFFSETRKAGSCSDLS